MNIYVVVEGICEKHVYKNWIPHVNKRLSFVNYSHEIQSNNFYILTGGGFPAYYDSIDIAIEEVNTYGNIDRLVIGIDSECRAS